MGQKRILIADDEAHMARVMSLFLQREGYAVEWVRDGQAALDAILRRPPDILLTDINMPRMSGRELCQQLAKRLPRREFKIFVITSMAEREHREWPAEMRDTEFIEKPVSMRSLVATLARQFEAELVAEGAVGAG